MLSGCFASVLSGCFASVLSGSFTSVLSGSFASVLSGSFASVLSGSFASVLSGCFWIAAVTTASKHESLGSRIQSRQQQRCSGNFNKVLYGILKSKEALFVKFFISLGWVMCVYTCSLWVG